VQVHVLPLNQGGMPEGTTIVSFRHQAGEAVLVISGHLKVDGR